MGLGIRFMKEEQLGFFISLVKKFEARKDELYAQVLSSSPTFCFISSSPFWPGAKIGGEWNNLYLSFGVGAWETFDTSWEKWELCVLQILGVFRQQTRFPWVIEL